MNALRRVRPVRLVLLPAARRLPYLAMRQERVRVPVQPPLHLPDGRLDVKRLELELHLGEVVQVVHRELPLRPARDAEPGDLGRGDVEAESSFLDQLVAEDLRGTDPDLLRGKER